MTILVVTSRTVEEQVRLVAEHFRGLRTDPRISRYFELVSCISGILFVYLTENNKLHGAQVSLLLLRTNFCRNYFVEHPLVRYALSRRSKLSMIGDEGRFISALSQRG